MFFRVSPRLRLVRRFTIGWLLVLLVAVYLEFLKWMRVCSIPRVGSYGTLETRMGYALTCLKGKVQKKRWQKVDGNTQQQENFCSESPFAW